MKSIINVQVRVFPVMIRDERTGAKTEDEIVLTKDQLRAAGEIGIDYKGLIYNIYNRKGYRVLNICPPTKKGLQVDLQELCRRQDVEESTVTNTTDTDNDKTDEQLNQSEHVLLECNDKSQEQLACDGCGVASDLECELFRIEDVIDTLSVLCDGMENEGYQPEEGFEDWKALAFGHRFPMYLSSIQLVSRSLEDAVEEMKSEIERFYNIETKQGNEAKVK